METLNGNESLDELQVFFVKLSEKKGGYYAYDFLLNKKFNSKVNLHLLGHVVGEQMYKQYGLEAMKYCTPDIQNACSHAIVIGYLLENGESKLSDIKKICRGAPGGPSAYLQCFHGLGHALMAYEGYDLRAALSLCSIAAGRSEELMCAGGAVMEIISGGLHDPTMWNEKRSHYLKIDDPLSPCNTNLVPQRLKSVCYSFLTPYLLRFNNSESVVDEKNIRLSFKLCDNISRGDSVARESCYGGFGKEFVVLSQETNTVEEQRRVSYWCSLAGDTDGIISCVKSALNSYFWGGENSYDSSIKLCNLIQVENVKNACFEKIIELVKGYSNEKKYVEKFCSSLPGKYRRICELTN